MEPKHLQHHVTDKTNKTIAEDGTETVLESYTDHRLTLALIDEKGRELSKAIARVYVDHKNQTDTISYHNEPTRHAAYATSDQLEAFKTTITNRAEGLQQYSQSTGTEGVSNVN